MYVSNESIDARKAEFEVVTLFGQRGLYTDRRVCKPTVPENLYKYDLRGSDNNFLTPATIEKGVGVNYCGAVIFAKPIDFEGKDYRRVKNKINFLGEKMKLNGFCAECGLEPPAPIKYELAIAAGEEKSLFYSSEVNDTERGVVGHCRMDFGSGKEFHSTWWPHNDDAFNTPEFKSDLQSVVDELRKTGLLFDRTTMENYCCEHYEAKMESNSGHSIFGFKTETENYEFFLRCTPGMGEYDCYLYAYDKRQQEQNMVQQPDEGMTMGGMNLE